VLSAWQNDGKDIVAEVAAGASSAVLKGNYWLDEFRIRQQIRFDTQYLEKRLQTLRDQTGSQFEEQRRTYNGALKQLEFAEGYLRVPSPRPYSSLHKAVAKIADAESVLSAKGLGWDLWLSH
jgi:hypothetical protein